MTTGGLGEIQGGTLGRVMSTLANHYSMSIWGNAPRIDKITRAGRRHHRTRSRSVALVQVG